MKRIFKNDWQEILSDFLESEIYQKIRFLLYNEYENQTIYPPKELIFNAFNKTSYKDTKVLILGQDPYHQKGQANGLSFSVNRNIKIPPSLRNIYKELQTDLNLKIPNHGDLTKWAEQGVLLLNASLTVRDSSPQSHSKIGWYLFTDYVIEKLAQKESPMVFILWGNFARQKKNLINNDKHLILESAHPSPFAAHRGFFGSKPFSKCNDFLNKNGLKEIDWQIEDI
ncbi:MAG: uracil-DNA glycosylase [Tissierellia bacterium]|nr:uracil-DNA glycosylase [Tissierellia bacterium]